MSGLSLTNRDLVRMKTAAGVIVPHSLCVVGHEMMEGAVIIDINSEPIEPKKMFVTYGATSQIVHHEEGVIDPGPEYDVCFKTGAPGHRALMYKSTEEMYNRYLATKAAATAATAAAEKAKLNLQTA